jgi:hypothetical protein
VLPRLRARAEKKPATTAGRRYAGEQVKSATAFLRWLSGRDVALDGCRQADVDAWYADGSVRGRGTIRPFLQWCVGAQLTGRFRLPPAVIRHAAPLPDDKRISHLGRILTARTWRSRSGSRPPSFSSTPSPSAASSASPSTT